jgi:predicted kinase
MAEVIMMVGLVGSGKSTIAQKIHEEKGYVIISSDTMREELFGSVDVQDKNRILFEKMGEKCVELCKKGVNCVYDATNLTKKHRISFIKSLPSDTSVIALVVATLYEDSLKRNAKRDRNVPEDVIKAMREKFQLPMKQEGFSDVVVVINSEYNKFEYAKKLVEMMDGFEQDNKNHTYDLLTHVLKAREYYEGDNESIGIALSLHDVGKLFTKKFENFKGEPTEDAKFLNHENVSSYEALFLTDDLYAIQLVNYHMRHYMLKTEKAINRLKNFVGEQMFEDLKIVNECDRKAH